MSISMYEYIQRRIEEEKSNKITKSEWTKIRNSGTPEEIAEAVARMAACGGYENLE